MCRPRAAVCEEAALRRLAASIGIAALALVAPAAGLATPPPSEIDAAAALVAAEKPAALEAVEAAPAAAPAGDTAPDAANAEGDGKDEADDADTDEGDEGVDEEAESHEAAGAPAPGGPRYSGDLDDAELERRWKEAPAELGSVSVGFTDAGRVINAEQFPSSRNWIVVDPANTWATRETIDYVTAAIDAVVEQYPDSPPLRVNHISRKDGGYLRPHRSHQAGRDVDLAFYYRTADPVRVRERERHIQPALNWALVRALVTRTDVQVILVDKRIIKVLYDYAVEAGEDRAWLDSIFRAGQDSLVKHARRHRDHFHVRFFNPRAQELGRRVQPLLAQRPDQNVTVHRIRRGDTLGGIARRYGSSVVAIRRANGLRSNLLRVGRTLAVPLRGPCTKCPMPPEVVVPPRRLPPSPPIAAKDEAAAPSAEADGN